MPAGPANLGWKLHVQIPPVVERGEGVLDADLLELPILRLQLLVQRPEGVVRLRQLHVLQFMNLLLLPGTLHIELQHQPADADRHRVAGYGLADPVVLLEVPQCLDEVALLLVRLGEGCMQLTDTAAGLVLGEQCQCPREGRYRGVERPLLQVELARGEQHLVVELAVRRVRGDREAPLNASARSRVVAEGRVCSPQAGQGGSQVNGVPARLQ